MSDPPNDGAPRPLTLTTNPRLDAAAQAGWEAWDAAAREAGAEAVAGWLARRAGDADLRREALPAVRAVLAAAEPDEAVAARAELAELAEEIDDLLADTLWEGVLAAAREAEDGDAVAEATGRLAAIAEANGDPLAAAEFHVEFLNWRRQPGHASDPEAVETAFDEVIRLAERDGNPKAAAIYAYRQAGYTRLLEADDDRAVEGDWERDPAPYEGWT
jgi:hypothetical protein